MGFSIYEKTYAVMESLFTQNFLARNYKITMFIVTTKLTIGCIDYLQNCYGNVTYLFDSITRH